MKKLLTLVLALALAISCLALTACGGGVEGKYKLYQVQMTMEGVTTTYNIGDVAPWGDDVLSEDMTIELKANGVCESANIIDGETLTMSGTYVIDGETITVTQDGVSLSGTIKDGTISMGTTIEGVTITYIYKK